MVLWKEVKLSKEVLTQKVNFNPALQKIEDLPDNSAFPELHHIPRYDIFAAVRQYVMKVSILVTTPCLNFRVNTQFIKYRVTWTHVLYLF